MSANFVTIWLAVGSLAGLMAERFLLPFIAQCLVFAAVSLLCIILLRPFCTRVLHSKTQPTNIAALIGKRAVALCDLNSFDVGEAKIGSRIWSAIAIEGSAIVAGNYGIIREIQGVKLVLEPAEP
ncbi:MAG: NfeD family protein, partial [Spirochaetota bacterium]